MRIHSTSFFLGRQRVWTGGRDWMVKSVGEYIAYLVCRGSVEDEVCSTLSNFSWGGRDNILGEGG